MRLKIFISGIVLAIGLMFIVIDRAWAQSCGGCQVYQDCNFFDPVIGEYVCQWIDACNGCNVVGCPSGQYYAPGDGQCHDVGQGGGGGGGGGYEYQTCSSGTSPTGGAGGLSCTTGRECNLWFPSTSGPDDNCGSENKGSCTINQLCCASGQAVECGSIVSTSGVLPTDTYYDGYRGCPGAGQARVGIVGTANEDVAHGAYCREQCACVTPCGQRPGTSVSCSDQSYGTYTRLNQPSYPTTCNDGDDRYISHKNSSQVYRTYWDYKDPNCEGRRCERELITEYYVETTCEKIIRICSCVSSCTGTAPRGVGYDAVAGELGWTPGQAGASQNLYVSKNESDVYAECGAGTSCAVSQSGLGAGVSSYAFSPELDPASRYHVIIKNIENDTCEFTGYAFFDTPVNNQAWWQAVDGSVHANAGGIRSQIPVTCTGSCLPNLISGTSGLMSLSGSYDLGEGTISQSGDDWQASTIFGGVTTGYAYFNRLLSDDPAGIGAWDGSLPLSNGVYRIEDNAVTVGDWNVGASDVFVLLADGNVTIDGNINVAPGGFLAIISSGSVAVDPAVTNVEGVIIADGIFSTGVSDEQLTAEGIFTGWTDVNLERDLADNSQTPAEVFVYRPDLQLNAYRYLLWMNISWREVAP